MGTLYIIATPIGNLADITLRALETLKSLDVLFCEDTRVTAKLLARYELSVRLESYREEVHAERARKVMEYLAEGKKVGLVSDAGTPMIADPGYRLVDVVRREMPEVKIDSLPGASAVITALSLSGFYADEFVFLGFPPNKKGRETWFAALVLEKRTVIFYESPHRIVKALEQLAKSMPERRVFIAREITKMFETQYRGAAAELLATFPEKDVRGEFVVVLDRE